MDETYLTNSSELRSIGKSRGGRDLKSPKELNMYSPKRTIISPNRSPVTADLQQSFKMPQSQVLQTSVEEAYEALELKRLKDQIRYLEQEKQDLVITMDKKIAFLKSNCRNFIHSATKIASFLLRKSTAETYALRIFENDKMVLENCLDRFVKLLLSANTIILLFMSSE